MRCRFAFFALVGLSLFTLGGCSSGGQQLVQAARWSRWKPKPPAVSPDAVEIHYIFLERDEGSSELGESLWQDVDEQTISMETKGELASNGLRIGKLGSQLSSNILRLLERSNSSGEGRRHFSHSGRSVKVMLTGIAPTMHLFRVENGQPKGDEFANAQGFLNLTPVYEPKGDSIHLAITPELEHGELKESRVPTADLSGWQVKSSRGTVAFPKLKVEMDLHTGEYIVIGSTSPAGAMLGQCLFCKTEKSKPKQTVLLVRVIRPSREELQAAGHNPDDFFLSTLPEVHKPSGELAVQPPCRVRGAALN